MLTFYFLLILGALFVAGALISFAMMYRQKTYPLSKTAKNLGVFVLGAAFLAMSLPTLPEIIQKDYDVVSGACAINVNASSRSSTADFTMQETNDVFIFNEIPELDAYGKAVPYYCEITVTSDHFFEIGFKIYDARTRKLLATSD